MKRYVAVFMFIVILLIWGCSQDTPTTYMGHGNEMMSMSNEGPDAHDLFWQSEATLWETMDFQPGRCDDPISFAQLCMGDPDVFMEIPATVVVIGRRMCSPLAGDFANPNPDAVRMRLRARIDHHGNGHGNGLIEFRAAIGELQGMLRGTFRSEFRNHMSTGTFEAMGVSGDFADRRVYGRFTETDSGFRFEGTLCHKYPGD